MFTVIQQGEKQFNIINLDTGVFVNRIIPPGKVLSGPVVVGNRCTIVIDDTNGNTIGLIYSLPQATIINRYVV